MKVYVAAPLAAVTQVRDAQERVRALGHELTLDWSRDLSLVEGFAGLPERSAAMAAAMMTAVLAADHVMVLATAFDGRGMFVELGAAVARTQLEDRPPRVAVVGPIEKESAFYFHPVVRRFRTLDDWLPTLTD